MSIGFNKNHSLVDSLPKGTTVETVVFLSRKDVHERIKFDVNIEELKRLNQPE